MGSRNIVKTKMSEIDKSFRQRMARDKKQKSQKAALENTINITDVEMMTYQSIEIVFQTSNELTMKYIYIQMNMTKRLNTWFQHINLLYNI